MAYGTSISRGVLGDPSAQARGKRAGTVEGASGLKEWREDRKEKKANKPPKDIPLRKWPDHKKALDEMEQKLKDSKKSWLMMPRGDERDAAKDAWRNSMHQFNETAVQFQNIRNQAHASWEAQVDELAGLEGSDVYGGEKGRGAMRNSNRWNKSYPTMAEEYRNLRGGGNISLDDWDPLSGNPPNFKYKVQSVVTDDQPVDPNTGEVLTDANGEPITQYTTNTIDGGSGPLDSSAYATGAMQFKFFPKSFTDSQGRTIDEDAIAEANNGVVSQAAIKEAGPTADQRGADGGEWRGRETGLTTNQEYVDNFGKVFIQDYIDPKTGEVVSGGGWTSAGATNNPFQASREARGFSSMDKKTGYAGAQPMADGGNVGYKFDINGRRIR